MDIDLFSQQKSEPQEKAVVSTSFLSYIKSFEKVILLIIGFMICGIIAFSLGVEKGKKAAGNQAVAQETALEPLKPQAVMAATQNIPQKAAAEPMAQPATKPAVAVFKKTKAVAGNYTVQLGSFQSRDNAQREALALKNKCFAPILITKGNLTILCVGNFSSKEKADVLLSKLKNQYQGYIIRRL